MTNLEYFSKEFNWETSEEKNNAIDECPLYTVGKGCNGINCLDCKKWWDKEHKGWITVLKKY